MSKYRITYLCSNGHTDVEYVYAANRIAAVELFMSLGYDGVIDVHCIRVTEGEV